MFSAMCRCPWRGPLRGFPWQGSHGQTGEGGDAELHLEISTGGVEGLRDAARRCDRPKVMVWCGKVMGQLGEGMGLIKVKRKTNCMSF